MDWPKRIAKEDMDIHIAEWKLAGFEVLSYSGVVEVFMPRDEHPHDPYMLAYYALCRQKDERVWKFVLGKGREV